MPARIDIQTAGLTPMMAFLDPVRFEKDLTAGLRYASRGAETETRKNIGARYALPAARIRQDQGKPRMEGSTLVLGFKRRPPTLGSYGGRALARGGYTYQVFRGQRERRSDIFELPIGPGLPFKRENGKLITLYGPSIGSIFVGRSRFGDELRRGTTERVMTQFIVGVKRELARRARGF
jgi:hypothetical protein